MKKYQMWIDGKWVEAASGKTYKVVNPATEEEIAQIPLGSAADVNRAVEAARKAYPVWSKKTQEERTKILNEIAASIEAHAQELAAVDILDHGSPAGFAQGSAHAAAFDFKYAAEASKYVLGTGEFKPSPEAISYLQREPIGVCALIIPWNAPLTISGKVASALATGNTCVAKPPSIDSLQSIKFAEILAQHDLPPGVVNIVTGPGDTVGEALVSHPGVGMVAFTGSCETGKAIMAAASKTTKRLYLELGGKNPFIVLEDADMDAAISTAIFTSFINTGMICASPGRYYIHEKLYDKFVDRFVAEAKKVVVGDPNDPDTFMGPVVSAAHRDRVEYYIKKGIEEGATLRLGGKRPTRPPLNKGYYITPTVFADVTQQMTIAREEIFGPVACFLRFSSEDEVVALANDTTYGLSASVWTKDATKSINMANAIQAGTVWINSHMSLVGELPWGGFKESGFGKENCLIGLQEYTQIKAISLDLSKNKVRKGLR